MEGQQFLLPQEARKPGHCDPSKPLIWATIPFVFRAKESQHFAPIVDKFTSMTIKDPPAPIQPACLFEFSLNQDDSGITFTEGELCPGSTSWCAQIYSNAVMLSFRVNCVPPDNITIVMHIDPSKMLNDSNNTVPEMFTKFENLTQASGWCTCASSVADLTTGNQMFSMIQSNPETNLIDIGIDSNVIYDSNPVMIFGQIWYKKINA